MGRRAGKLKVELIENSKSRNLAFKRRKECLMRKMKELSTLCDVNACMILYAPDHDAPTAPVSVWPPNDPALVRRLIHHNRAKNSKNDDDDDEKAQFGVCLRKKAQQVRAQIDRLKSERQRVADQQQQQDQFASTAMMVPSGNRDEDGKAQLISQFAVDLQKKAQQVRARIGELKQRELTMDDQYDQQQDQFGHTIDLDNSSTALMMPGGPLTVDDSTDDDNDDDDDQYPQQQQQQYELFDSSSSMYQEKDSSTAMMMMMDDAITAEQSCYSGMAGFDDQDEGASCSRQTAGGDDDVAVQDNFYNHEFIAQLYTPPMMTWQSTDDDLMFQDNVADDYLQCIDFDDLWV